MRRCHLGLLFFIFSEKSLVAARHRHSSRCGEKKKEPSVSSLPLPCVALLANVFCMTPRESHATCVTCAASCPNGPVSVRTRPVWTDNSASACQRGTMQSFLVRKRVCNTICSLNGARHRVRGWSCITTATVLQETTVGVCVCVCGRSISSGCLVQVMYDIVAPFMTGLSYYHQVRTASDISISILPCVAARKPCGVLQVITLNKEQKSCSACSGADSSNPHLLTAGGTWVSRRQTRSAMPSSPFTLTTAGRTGVSAWNWF